MTNFATDLKEMMGAWTKIEDAARQMYPNASKEEVYRLTSGAMNRSLGRSK